MYSPVDAPDVKTIQSTDWKWAIIIFSGCKSQRGRGVGVVCRGYKISDYYLRKRKYFKIHSLFKSFLFFFFLLMTTYGIVCVTGVVRNGPRWRTQSLQMAGSFTDDRQKLKVLRRTSRMNRRIRAGDRTEQTQETKLRSKQADVEKQDRFWGPTGMWRQVRYETQVKVIWGVKEANSKQDTGGNYQNKTGNNNHKWNKRTLKCEGCSSGRENEWTT